MTMRILVIFVCSILLVGKSSAQGLGKITDVLVESLPYYSEKGAHLGSIEAFSKVDFKGQLIKDTAPRGLIQLEFNGQDYWFRSLHFSVENGVIDDCPDTRVSEAMGTKKPVTINMEGDCKPSS